MGKHFLICLFFACFIATSCENTSFEEISSTTQGTTRSTPEELGYFGSYFQEAQYNNNEAFGYITFNPSGAEYGFSFGTFGKSSVKSVVSIIGGSITYNGRDMGSQIDGDLNKIIKFTVKFTSNMAKVTMTLKPSTPTSDITSYSARIVIDSKTYNGKYLPSPAPDDSIGDLIIGKLP